MDKSTQKKGKKILMGSPGNGIIIYVFNKHI